MPRKHNRCGIEESSSANKLGSPPINLSNTITIARRKLAASSGAIVLPLWCSQFWGILRLKHMTKDKKEGRIRAIEAVLLHLPGINLDAIQAAKDWRTLSGNPIRRLPK